MDQLTKNNITHILAIHDNAQPVPKVYTYMQHAPVTL